MGRRGPGNAQRHTRSHMYVVHSIISSVECSVHVNVLLGTSMQEGGYMYRMYVLFRL